MNEPETDEGDRPFAPGYAEEHPQTVCQMHYPVGKHDLSRLRSWLFERGIHTDYMKEAMQIELANLQLAAESALGTRVSPPYWPRKRWDLELECTSSRYRGPDGRIGTLFWFVVYKRYVLASVPIPDFERRDMQFYLAILCLRLLPLVPAWLRTERVLSDFVEYAFSGASNEFELMSLTPILGDLGNLLDPADSDTFRRQFQDQDQDYLDHLDHLQQ